MTTTMRTSLYLEAVMFDVNKLLEHAVKETDNLSVGERFLVRDLFVGYMWNRIPHKDRLLLGILFMNFIKNTREGFFAIEKTPSNQQRYTKMRE